MSFRQDQFGNFGGGLRFGPGLPLGPAIKGLLIANTLLFFVPSLIGFSSEDIYPLWALYPPAVLHGQIWQVFSYMFLHGGFMHLFFNMLMLWMFGTALEHMWGTRSFLSYYIICGLGAAILQIIVSVLGWGSAYVVGASGAIYGLLLAYGLAYPDRVILVSLIFPIKMRYFVWLMIGMSLILGLMNAPGDSVAHFAHLGGALTGWMYLKQDWRLGALGRRVRGQRARRQMQRNAQASQKRQEQAKSVDEILDKISAQGIDSLSEEEKRILREASRH